MNLPLSPLALRKLHEAANVIRSAAPVAPDPTEAMRSAAHALADAYILHATDANDGIATLCEQLLEYAGTLRDAAAKAPAKPGPEPRVQLIAADPATGRVVKSKRYFNRYTATSKAWDWHMSAETGACNLFVDRDLIMGQLRPGVPLPWEIAEQNLHSRTTP
jgi:hypothetical protein